MKKSQSKKSSSSTSTPTSSASPSSTDLFDYLTSLPSPLLRSLYADPTRGSYAAQTVLQKLNEVGRQSVWRLMACGGVFPYAQVSSWTKRPRDTKAAVQQMASLAVIQPISLPRKDGNNSGEGTTKAYVQLTSEYKAALQKSMSSFSSAPYEAVSSSMHIKWAKEQSLRNKSNDPKIKSADAKYPNRAPSFTELETFAQRRWDSVLHFLVGSDSTAYGDPPDAVIQFLQETGLMQEDPEWNFKKGGVAPLVITSKGYEFMLLEVHVQVWQFLLQYIIKITQTKVELQKEALLFLISLSYCTVGNAYPADQLNKCSKIFIQDYSLFGLVHVVKIGGHKLFYPTRVAVNLVVGGLVDANTQTKTSTSSAAATRALELALAAPKPSTHHIAIIVQTNFQVCAYTTSSLHVSMLGLFCDVHSFRRLPNVIFYRITRDSIKAAFALGIQASQILKFLKLNAHPRLRTGDQSLLPDNVEDQILLWDRERTRVTMTQVHGLQCLTREEYRAVKLYAEDWDACGWFHEGQNRILIKYESAERVMNYVRQWRAQMAQRQADADAGTFH